MRRICVVDTDWLLAYLSVPGFERAGPDRDPVTSAVAQAQWTEELAAGSQFILAYAVIIEAGNHIAHAKHSRREYAMDFTRIIRDTLDENAPWAPFDETPDAQRLRALLEDISAEWPR